MSCKLKKTHPDCRAQSHLQYGTVTFLDSGVEIIATAACDYHFVALPGPVSCITSADARQKRAATEGQLICQQVQTSNICGQSCYIPIIVVCGLLILALPPIFCYANNMLHHDDIHEDMAVVGSCAEFQ